MDHIGGDPNAPRGLQRAFGSLGGFKQYMRKAVKKKRKASMSKTAIPRRICCICTNQFDNAVVDLNSQIVVDRCPDCQMALNNGYYAVISLCGAALIKVTKGFEDLTGKVIRLPEEKFKEVVKKHEQKEKPNPGTASDN